LQGTRPESSSRSRKRGLVGDRAEAGHVTAKRGLCEGLVRKAFQGPGRKRRKGPSKVTVEDRGAPSTAPYQGHRPPQGLWRGTANGPVRGTSQGPFSRGLVEGLFEAPSRDAVLRARLKGRREAVWKRRLEAPPRGAASRAFSRGPLEALFRNIVSRCRLKNQCRRS
jgi:hypothetical protein